MLSTLKGTDGVPLVDTRTTELEELFARVLSASDAGTTAAVLVDPLTWDRETLGLGFVGAATGSGSRFGGGGGLGGFFKCWL